MISTLRISIIPETLGIYKIEADQASPELLARSSFYCISTNGEEKSIVCPEELIPEEAESIKGWRGLKIHLPGISEQYVLPSILKILANANVVALPISTLHNIHILVKISQLKSAISALLEAGHSIQSS